MKTFVDNFENDKTQSLQNETVPDLVSNPPHDESYLQSLRRSVRIKNKNNIVVSNWALNLREKQNETLKCFEDAINCLNAGAWQDAMNKELDSIKGRDVFEIVERPKNVKVRVIKSKWVYSIETINDGDIYKARLVAAAYHQIKNKDSSGSYSAVH